MSNLAKLYVTSSRFAEAEPLAREALKIRERKTPDDWITFDTCSLLGASLLGQKKYAEAEVCLVRGFDGLSERAVKIPVRNREYCLAHAGDRVVALYDGWGKKGKADEWRRKVATAVDTIKPKR